MSYQWRWPDPPFEILFHLPPDTTDAPFAWVFIAEFRPASEGVFVDTIVRSFDANGYPTNTCLVLRGEGVVTQEADPFILPPASFSLAVYPNPFNAKATIRFSLPAEAQVSLALYDVQGREAAAILNEHFSAGEHTVFFDGTALSTGLYFARLATPIRQMTTKVLLIK